MSTKSTQTKLKSTIKERGLTQGWIARQLDVTDATVSRWVQGHGLPTPRLQKALSEMLGKSIDELFFSESYNHLQKSMNQGER